MGTKPKAPAKTKAAKTPKAKKPCKGELLEETSALLKRIETAEEECQTARIQVEIHKRNYQTARASYGERIEELRALCRARKEKHPLFEAAAKRKKEEAASPIEDWRKIDIKQVIADESLSSKLIDAGFSTLGALEDHRKEQGVWWAKSLKGIGEASADKISDAIIDWWAKHPECAEPTDESADTIPMEQPIDETAASAAV